MPGPRQRLSVLEANGRKHLSKAEKAERAGQEVTLPKACKNESTQVAAGSISKADFRALAKELLAADMGAAQLDRDTLGRYVAAQHQFTAACRMVQDALDQEDPDLVNAWSRAQKTYLQTWPGPVPTTWNEPSPAGAAWWCRRGRRNRRRTPSSS